MTPVAPATNTRIAPTLARNLRPWTPDPVEIRVLGCLIEKQRTTPDAYPLSLNALRLACNQSTNREPVVDYDEATIRDALRPARPPRLDAARERPGSRAAKYRHLLDEALGARRRRAARCSRVLMLRGPQTPGELKQRTERLHAFGDLDELERRARAALAERELVARLARRPGQKEERYAQLLGAESPEEAALAPAPAGEHGHRPDRLSALEEEVAALREEVETLRAELEVLRSRA